MVLGLHQEKQSIQCKVQVDYAYESSYQRKALSLHGEYNFFILQPYNLKGKLSSQIQFVSTLLVKKDHFS